MPTGMLLLRKGDLRPDPRTDLNATIIALTAAVMIVEPRSLRGAAPWWMAELSGAYYTALLNHILN